MAWQDPLAEHPAQLPDLTVFTHVALESVLMTMPCSVAIIEYIGNFYNLMRMYRFLGTSEFALAVG
jgi:hypothetical protein